MTNERIEEIARAARLAAMAARSGWPVMGVPAGYTSDEAKVWQQRFDAAVKGGR